MRDSTLGDGEHVVQFYDRDSDLVRAVGDYLLRAVSEGEVAIVIATESHRRAVEEELAAGGVDVERALADGSLVALDAAETLATFVHEGEVDPAAFRASVAPVVHRAQRDGRPVRAYGEMVNLLWDAGDVLGAIELEKLWNELGRDLSFALWCGYHTRSVAGDEHAEALHQVCHLHTAVVDAATARFRAGPDAAYAARPFSVSVRYDGSVIRIAVHDWNPALPVMREAGPLARSGRGLHLVAEFALDWGVEPSPDGKTVWAELPLR